jgi:hypothetical protein
MLHCFIGRRARQHLKKGAKRSHRTFCRTTIA